MNIFLKKSLVLIFTCFLTSVSYGQSAIGGKIGIHMATYKGDTEDLGEGEEGGETVSNFGFQFGGVFEIGVNDLISIQPELLVIQKGVKLKASEDFFGSPLELENSLIFQYIEVPLLMKLKFGNLESTNFFVNVGPSFGYALSGRWREKITIGQETEETKSDFEFDENDTFNRFDLSVALGAGVNFPIGPGKLFVEARYLLGLSNLSDAEDETLRNGGYGLSVGYMIPIGK